MRSLLGQEIELVGGAGTQVFDDGSSLTTDDNGNVVEFTDSDGNSTLVINVTTAGSPSSGFDGCTLVGGSTTVTNIAQVTTTTYSSGTGGPTISNAIATPASSSVSYTSTYFCPNGVRR